ncbi:uncharacterized protein METZ01_LOCUS287835, partial [marine metagenome]
MKGVEALQKAVCCRTLRHEKKTQNYLFSASLKWRPDWQTGVLSTACTIK